MKVLVVGLGSMGKRRIRLLQRFKEIELIVGVDGREDRGNEVKEKYCIDVYQDILEVLEDIKDIDLAFVCTSPLTHNSIIGTLLNADINVFAEINLVKDGYEENIVLAKRKGLTLFLSSTFLYREEIRYIRNKISNKGKINYVYHVGQYLPNWHPWENINDFFVGDKRTNGCRELMAIEFPWIIKTFGHVKNFSVISNKISSLNISYNDNYMIQFEHENGNKGLLIIDIVSPKAVRNLEIYGENIYYSWDGTPDSLEEYNRDTREIESVRLDEESEHLDGYSVFITENAYSNEIREFIDVVEGKKEPLYGFEQDYEILSLIDKIEGI